MFLIIHQDLAQRIHDYLLTRPMSEVESLVLGIRGLPQLPESPVDNEGEE